MKPILIVTIFFFVGVIYLLIALTYYLYNYNLLHSCRQYANIWCWTDWECSGESDPAYQYPAENFYGCNGTRPRNAEYCTGAPPNTPGCVCSFAAGTDGQLPPECTCEWDNSQYGQCGSQLCSGADVANCDR